ncbi:MAG: DsbA family oxidoreductase [Parvularculaceae bacterium]
MTARMLVDLVADPVCPWCFVGIESYRKTLPALAPDFEVVTRYRPYQLNPDTPEAGVDRHAHYRKKFPDSKKLGAMREVLKSAAREIGVDFDPAGPSWLPNTIKAHQLIHWAHFEGKQADVVLSIYRAFWRDGADIGDIDILCAIADAAQMDAAAIKSRLVAGKDAQNVRGEAIAFANAGVSGVPTFIVNERTGFSGGMPPAKLEAALRHAAETTANTNS